MKLAGAQAVRFFQKPDPSTAGLLIYGSDSMRVALRRQEVIKAIAGPDAEAEMRITRLSATSLKNEPSAAVDGLKAQGFFPGPRVVFVEDATEVLAKPILMALEAWQKEDACLIVTASSLKATSKLRKAFEAHPKAYAVGIYDDPPSQEEIMQTLQAACLERFEKEAERAIHMLARSLDPGDFRQTIDKLALYKLNDSTDVTPQDIEAVSPSTYEADIDEILHACAEGKVQNIGPLLRRLAGQGRNPVTLCISALRHYQTLYSAACDPKGVSAGMARARPPVFGPRKDRMARQASNWGLHRLEAAVRLITETDLSLRSTSAAPQMAVIERMFIRLAMQAPR